MIIIIRKQFKHLKIHVLLAALAEVTAIETTTTTATTTVTNTATFKDPAQRKLIQKFFFININFIPTY